jgi:4-diphosphocytidyl-2-C-methyl-D-erythritol kinase
MRFSAPAKLNLNFVVSSRDDSGLHPIRSVVQTVELLDTLEADTADEDRLTVRGDDETPDNGDNLVVKALEQLRGSVAVPPISFQLDKRIPAGAGLGGGSSDAAAALLAGCEVARVGQVHARKLAPSVGADVSFPLVGGTAEMSGSGEKIEPMDALQGFAVALVVPDFRLSTPDVYQRWDALGEPVGFEVPDRLLPPSLRNRFPVRNDLYRAAVDVEPRLGDFVSDVAHRWDSVVMMTGSGSACFGYFANVEEAQEAAASVTGTRAALGVALRPKGVSREDD